MQLLIAVDYAVMYSRERRTGVVMAQPLFVEVDRGDAKSIRAAGSHHLRLMPLEEGFRPGAKCYSPMA